MTPGGSGTIDVHLQMPVTSCCSAFDEAVDRQFSEKRAAEELARYRQNGPGPTTRLLLEGLAISGGVNGTLLDIGAGVGSLTFALLEQGVDRAVGVDASAAYVAAAREEAERRNRTASTQFVHGDFVQVAAHVPVADLVTLDRVVCCYPLLEPLLEEALRHTARCIALSYPRDTWYVRAALAAENGGRRLMRNPFRTFVHPVAAVEQIVQHAGFELAHRSETWMWRADVYVARPSETPATT